jgi:hypothetical protein
MSLGNKRWNKNIRPSVFSKSSSFAGDIRLTLIYRRDIIYRVHPVPNILHSFYPNSGFVQTYRYRLTSLSWPEFLQTNRSEHIGVTQLLKTPSLFPCGQLKSLHLSIASFRAWLKTHFLEDPLKRTHLPQPSTHLLIPHLTLCSAPPHSYLGSILYKVLLYLSASFVHSV